MFENIEKILNSKKIKYTVLDNLFKKYKSIFVPESTINIFIDLPSTIAQLYNPENIKNLSEVIMTNERYLISSVLLNMVGHYRHYFAKKFSCYTNIAFMYNSKEDRYIKSINSDYRKDYYSKRFDVSNTIFSDINLILKDNYKVMKTIIDHIPHCYFIDTTYMDYRCQFPFLIDTEEFKDNFNIIISTNKQMYQNTLLGETIILQPKGDNSNIILSNYIIRALAGKNKTIQTHPEYLAINPENIILIESLVNHKDLNTIGIRNFSYIKALTFINKNDIDINNIITGLSAFKEILKNTDSLTNEEINRTMDNFKIYNNFYLSLKYKDKLELNYPTYIKTINDYSELKKVNEKFYSKNPILLDFLFDGEAD